MKKILIISIALFSFSYSQAVFSQDYIPFSQDTVAWHNLFFHQWGPDPNQIGLANYRYIQKGDTLLNNLSYRKIYYEQYYEWQSDEQYIGGLREDNEKQIWFYPASTNLGTLPYNIYIGFLSDTTEYLIYTFNNLSIGDTIPVNTAYNTVIVMDVDSIVFDETFRKRYLIENNLMLGYEYWIEGIGSTKDLLSAYAWEFEWSLYTLCYKEEFATYYISSPDQHQYCYFGGVNIEEYDDNLRILIIAPNPASSETWLQLPEHLQLANVQIELYSPTGWLLNNSQPTSYFHKIDVAHLPKGLYLVRVWDGERWRGEKVVVQ